MGANGCCGSNCACRSTSTDDESKILVNGIDNCARCGGNHTEGVWFFRFTYPIQDKDGTLWTHWAACPTNGEPILAKMEEAPNADS